MRNTRTRRISVRSTTRCAVMSAVLCVSGFIKFQLPGLAVMTTAQVFAVLLVGLLLLPSEALLSVLVYVLVGLVGLPVFTRGGGLGTLATVEGGYIIGFIACAYAESLLLSIIMKKKKSRGIAARVISALAGIAALYMVALPYVAALRAITSEAIPLWTLVVTFCAPFIPLDLAKAAAAVVISQSVSRALERLK